MTIATLVLSPNPPPAYHADSMSMSGLDARTSTTLVDDADKLEFLFPAAREAQGQQPFSWLLDFTEGGKYPGVVMSQSRMRDIEMVVNPFGSIDHMSDVPMMAFGTGSWVDLLFNPHTQTPISPERYTALYTSPTSVHPPLQLRLNTPDEPGFILETIPVRTLKEVWSILEIVREQCWLNEILTSCQWVPEGLNPNQTVEDEADATVTEDDLQAVLKGHIEPRSIPVNIRIPQPVPPFSDSDMDAFSLGRGHARITMTTPERPPISGLVEITVTFDPGRARGVAVDITGAVGVDLSTEVLEEVCRRGGLLGLPGRVWMKAHQMP